MKSMVLLCILISSLVNSMNCSFQAKLFNMMNKNYNGENFVVSPLSIYQALSLAANGAQSNTLEEMLAVLDSKNIAELNQLNYDLLDILKDFSTVEIANAVMTRFTPLSTFTEISEKYLAPTSKLESAEQVNQWCSEKTHGKITKILDKLDSSILMLVLNALYFKDEWAVKFSKSVTSKKPFYNLGLEQNEVSIDTMIKQSSYNYFENDKVQAIELRFQKDQTSAIILLPPEGTSINDFIESINSIDNLYEILDKLSYKKVRLELPKFEIEFSVSLKEILQNMGMSTAFKDIANFTGLRKEGNLKIGEVLHKTYLKVNEDGTEAAAITMVRMIATSAGPTKEKIYEMKVNRPFLFLLRSQKLPIKNDLLFVSKIEKIEPTN